jgi:GNAT superfamily N-acetyltransferase
MTTPDQWLLREAVHADIPVLIKHRRWMFQDMLNTQPVAYTQTDVDAMETPYAEYLEKHFGTIIRAWVVEDEGRVISSGSILFQMWSPRPADLTGEAALLHSIYTEPDYRRQGLARRVTQALVTACRYLGYKTISLHASEAGRALYESLGFHPTSEMRLIQ